MADTQCLSPKSLNPEPHAPMTTGTSIDPSFRPFTKSVEPPDSPYRKQN